MSNVQPGTYRARVVNYTLSTTKTGNPQVEVLFEFSQGEGVHASHHQIRWWGQLTEKAIPYTLKNLITMGYRGTTNDDFARLAEGVEGGMIDLGLEVDLVMELEPNDQGKAFLKVKWINAPGGGFKAGMTKDQAKVKLGAMNIAGQLAMIRQEIGAPKPSSKPVNRAPAPSEPEGMNDDFDYSFGPA